MRSRGWLPVLLIVATALVGCLQSDIGDEPTAVSDRSSIAVAELPAEARETLDLIDRDGPYPYSQDDRTFFNRERLLPPSPRGYYREYTIDTPGADDRGARRFVVGDEGEIYYTDDHYASFVRVGR